MSLCVLLVYFGRYQFTRAGRRKTVGQKRINSCLPVNVLISFLYFLKIKFITYRLQNEQGAKHNEINHGMSFEPLHLKGNELPSFKAKIARKMRRYRIEDVAQLKHNKLHCTLLF